jgi:type IV pilus assembly protein PilN
MIRINLLPVKAARKRYGGLMQIVLLGVVLVLTMVVLWAPVPIWKNRAGMAQDIDKSQERLTHVKEEIDRYERIIGQVNQYEGKKKALEKRKEIIDALRAGKTGPVRLLDELAVRMPKKVWVTRIEEKNKSLSFTGEAVGYEDLSAFMAELEKSSFFADVALVKTESLVDQKRELKWIRFELTARVKYNI